MGGSISILLLAVLAIFSNQPGNVLISYGCTLRWYQGNKRIATHLEVGSYQSLIQLATASESSTRLLILLKNVGVVIGFVNKHAARGCVAKSII